MKHTIQGPIKFEKDKKVPQKMKNWIKENGIRLPFDAASFKYSNNEIDDWFRIKEKDKIYKMDRANNKTIVE